MTLVGNPFDFMVAFGAGVLVSFTPCVYPLIPISIGYIGAKAQGSRIKGFILSAIYALGIATTYSILGAIASLSGKVFGTLAGRPWPYFIVGNVCIILGLSLLDVFSIPTLSISSKRIEPKGLISTFLFGMTSGLVVGPCTAPALAVILTYVATRQNLAYGAFLLFSFAYGLCATLIFIGTFSSLIVNLPRSGAWLGKIKKVCGIILIGMGEYFLIQTGRYML